MNTLNINVGCIVSLCHIYISYLSAYLVARKSVSGAGVCDMVYTVLCHLFEPFCSLTFILVHDLYTPVYCLDKNGYYDVQFIVLST